MKLSRNHRQTLLDELLEALQEKENLSSLRNSETSKDDLQFAEAVEIKEFINDEKINTIKLALVDEEIDY